MMAETGHSAKPTRSPSRGEGGGLFSDEYNPCTRSLSAAKRSDALDAEKPMAESYAKHLDRLEHSRHAKRESRQAPITRTFRHHRLQSEHRGAHVHHCRG